MAADDAPAPMPLPEEQRRCCTDEGRKEFVAGEGDEGEHGGGNDDSSEEGTSAKPQSTAACSSASGVATEVWPERWGISLQQCRHLIADCREDSFWSDDFTMRDIVERYVKPQTAGLGMGYALKQNLARPLEVNIMVSHAWDENAADFFDALERSASEEDGLFICALSLYQCEDGAGPSIAEQLGTAAKDSPFRRVLDHIQSRREEGWVRRRLRQFLGAASFVSLLVGTLVFYYPMGAARCIPTIDGCARVKWSHTEHHSMLKYPNCWFPQFAWVSGPLDEAYRGFLPAAIALFAIAALLRCAQAISCSSKKGFMLAVPNYECDLYSRLWCVYEIFVAKKLGVPIVIAGTLAPAGLCRWERAHCSSERDSLRIRSEIARWEKRGTFRKVAASERVERAIKQVTRSAQYAMAATILSWAAPFIFMEVAMSVSGFGDSAHQRAHLWRRVETPPGICDGFLAIALGGTLVMGVAFHIARVKQGVLNRRICLTASVAFVAVGLALYFIDCLLEPRSSTRLPIPLHHCFVIVLIWGGLSMAVLTELHCLLHVQRRLRVFLFGAVAVGSVALYVWLGAIHGARQGEAYPLAVWFISFRAAPMLGVPCVLLVSADTWGIRFEGEPFWRGGWRCCCRRRRRTHQDELSSIVV